MASGLPQKLAYMVGGAAAGALVVVAFGSLAETPQPEGERAATSSAASTTGTPEVPTAAQPKAPQIPETDPGEEKDEPGFQSYEEELAWTRSRAAAFTRVLEDEPRDPDWAGPTEALLREKLAGNEALAGTSFEDVECRATMCRTEAGHVDERAQGEFADLFPLRLSGLPIGSFAHLNTEGKVRTVAFFMREGHQLPRVEVSKAD